MSVKYDKCMIETAHTFKELSYCQRNKVGAVISRDNRILVTGYNGTISGQENICEEYNETCSNCGEIVNKQLEHEEFNCSGCGFPIASFDPKKGYEKLTVQSFINKTSEFTIHAEQNAIFYAAKNGIELNESTIYITHSPCKQCSKAIASSGIKRVVYDELYGDGEGLEFLLKCGIKVEKHDKPLF
jgi:dCMP deaminase